MTELTSEAFRSLCEEAAVHTVEVAIADTYAHLRGKRVPVGRYFDEVAESGASIADAVFILNVRDELIDHETVNMENGFLDTRIVPDPATGRLCRTVRATPSCSATASTSTVPCRNWPRVRC